MAGKILSKFPSIIYESFFICVCVAMTSCRTINDKNIQKLKLEVGQQQDTAEKIIQFITNGPAKHQVYQRLAKFTDTFGSRVAGSRNLENAIDYMLEELRKDGLENVHGEPVNVTHWVRGRESAQMIQPRNYQMRILGLGSSVGTPPEGITAEVLVVNSFDELKQRSSEVKNSNHI